MHSREEKVHILLLAKSSLTESAKFVRVGGCEQTREPLVKWAPAERICAPKFGQLYDFDMQKVSLSDLRRHGDAIIDRVAQGERMTVTRNGVPVANLVSASSAPLGSELLMARWKALPQMDPRALRHDIDDIFGPTFS
jgi:prevent-host-death family protein